MRQKSEDHKTFFEQLNVSISLFPARSYENGTIRSYENGTIIRSYENGTIRSNENGTIGALAIC